MSVSSADRPPVGRESRGDRRFYSRRSFFGLLVGMVLVMVCGLIPILGFAAEPAGPAETAAPQSFEELLTGFASMAGFEARFVEEKTLSLLAVPLRSEGRIYFAQPSFLLREVTSPMPQKVLISSSQVRLSSGGREEVIDLASRAEVRPLVESLLWLFRGDRTALEGAFQVEFEGGRIDSGESAGWTLRLSPREAPLSHLLAQLVIRGDGLGARQIDVEEVSGDRSVMQIFDANPDRRFTPAEFESFFRSSPEANAVTGPDE